MDQHVILTLGRSGSNTLVDLCNQHPNLLNCGEVLGDWTVARRLQRTLRFHRGDDAAYLDALLTDRRVIGAVNTLRSLNKMRRGDFGSGKRLGRIRSVGFKDFSMNLVRCGLRDYLRRRDAIKVIGLQRRGALERLVSSQLLQKTGVVMRRDGDVDVPQLHLDPDRLFDDLQVIADENTVLDEILSELPSYRVYRIEYGDFFDSEDRTRRIMADVFDFLGVPRVPVRVRMHKIVQRGVLAAIANLEECRAAMVGTRYEHEFRETADA